MISGHDHKIQELVNDIENGNLLLPEMQRGYVWKSTQVRDLFDSLYRGYPSGQLLVWSTSDLPATSALSLEGGATASKTGRTPELLLDGQQRMTSLTAIIKGRPLYVRWKSKPIDIIFNVHNQQFEVAIPRYRNDPNWVSLTRLFTTGPMTIMQEQFKEYGFSPEGAQIMERLNRIDRIRDYTYRVNRLTEVEYAEVTEIFVRINSGGTRLSSADLTLAQLSSRWKGITNEFEDYQKALKQRFGIDLDSGIIVRTLASMFSGQSGPMYMFRGERSKATVDDIKPFWKRLKPAMEQAITFLVHNCLIDRMWMLPTQAILIPLTQYFDRHGANVTTKDARMLQRWVYLALIWSRYSFSPESSIDQDVSALAQPAPIDVLTQNIYDKFGERPVDERQLRDQRSNSPFMLMSYIIARTHNAQDWFNGVVIGSGQALEYHHIFPKALLGERFNLRADTRIVDQVANLAFVSSPSNKRISKRAPIDYLQEIDPSRLSAQYVPLDTSLWDMDHFLDFVLERRRMLADAINGFLDSLTERPTLATSTQARVMEGRIDVLEHRLRELVARRLFQSYGDDAWNEAVPSNLTKALDRRIEGHLAKHPYATEQYSTLADQLGNCLFSDYLKIMQHKTNWQLFLDVFGEPAVLAQHETAVRDARNAFKHHNALNDVQMLQAEAGLRWFERCLDKAEHREAELVETLDDEDEPGE